MTSAFEVPPDLEDLEVMSGMHHAGFFNDFEDSFEDQELRALGIDPKAATSAKPGSDEKVMMLAARYKAGLPLWHQEDCHDHGPRDRVNLEAELGER